MTIPAHILRASLDDALEVVALTDTRAKELVADVLADILILREHDIDEELIDRLLNALRRCCVLNSDLAAAGQRLSYRLDQLATMRAPSVKELAAELRPHLAIIADPRDYGTDGYVDAVCAVNDVIEATPFDRLAGGGMRRALGPGRHALLMAFARGIAEPLLTQHAKVPTQDCAGGELCPSAISPEDAGLATSSLEVAA